MDMIATSVTPQFMEFFGLGNSAAAAGDIDMAETYFGQAAAECPETWYGLAQRCYAEGNRMESMKRLVQAYNGAKNKILRARCLNNLGHIKAEEGDLDQAEECIRRSIKEHPLSESWSNLALVRYWQEDMKEAMEYIENAIAEDSGASHPVFIKSMIELSQGDYANGFMHYDSRWKSKVTKMYKPPMKIPEWTGIEPLAGKRICVYGEQGIGDQIMFARFLPKLRELGATVILGIHDSLIRLFKTVDLADVLLGHYENLPDANRAEFCIPLGNLPRALRIEYDTIPCGEIFRGIFEYDEPPGPFKVGICWHGEPRHKRDNVRSMQLHQIEPILRMENVEFHSLQLGDGLVDALRHPKLIDHSGELSDWLDTARLIARMNLVISVDTGVVHLAGAMGWPVWALVQKCPDWRWGLKGRTSRWYSTVELFRQQKRFDWDKQIAEVVERLGQCKPGDWLLRG